MDVKKLEKWAELLLDTGKRNNLINFKDTKASTVEVVLPNAELLFSKIDGNTSFEVFDPKLNDEDETEDQEQKDNAEHDFSHKKSEYINQYETRIKKQSQILLYNKNGTNPITALKNIDRKAKSYIDETGVNVAHFAFGFIHWKESTDSDVTFSAPILLVPIAFKRDSSIDPYYIKIDSDEVITNPTLSYLLDGEYGIKLPEYTDGTLTEYLEKINSIVSKLKWSVSSECKIGIFSFLKLNMYRDLMDNTEKILKNDNVKALLGDTSLELSNDDTNEESKSINNPLIELHNVVDADSSQIEAIEMAKSGKSFVLQGPPGTGKSQTITNIIAECLNDGKRVLFVSEKLAALNVVYEKLKQAGLSEFCLELHSHKANKKAVIDDLCHTLRSSKISVSTKVDTEIAIKEKNQRQLDTYVEELHKQRDVINKSVFQLYEDYSALRKAPDIEWNISNIEKRNADYLSETAALIEQYVQYTSSIGYNYKLNSWYGYKNQDLSYQTRANVKSDLSISIEFLNKLIPIADRISTDYAIECKNYNDIVNWNEFFTLAESTSFITPKLLIKAEFERINKVIKELKELSDSILEAKAEIDSNYDDEIYKIDGKDYNKRLTKLFSGTFSRLFNQEYSKIIGSLRLSKKNGKKPSYTEALYITEKLAVYQEKSDEFQNVEVGVKDTFGSAYSGVTTNWEYALEQTTALQSLFEKGLSFGNLAELSFDLFDAEKQKFTDYKNCIDTELSNGASEFTNMCESFDSEKVNYHALPANDVLKRFKLCLEDIEKLDNWCRFRTLLSKIEDQEAMSFIDYVIEHNIETEKIVDTFKKQYYYQWIDYIMFSTPVLSEFNRISHDQAISIFSQKDKEQFEINKSIIRSKLSSKRPSLDMLAGGSAVSILLREGEKKRKQKSVRTLLSMTGELVQILKPCFLMSPLSVSTFLGTDSVGFDVVIFDEASQIFPQDAIGAIYRAKQLIVVGDSKQMPPSNFFNSTVEANELDEETDDITDFESILDLCSAIFKQLRLCWHYRSRYEQLIAFSNKNFYDNELITFPSSKADNTGIGVDYYHINGIFDRQTHTNRKEAEAVVDLIYKNIEKFPNRSLGVVAFSVAQQELIDNILSKRRQSTPEKEFFFKSDAKEPFFIKNLETVQGDERDTIIFSVAYGIDSQGRLLHNFGPLNRVGGERRLNVAATRAKCNVQLVSSMHYTDIDLKRTSAEGAKLLREYLDYAENGNIALERFITTNSYEQFDSEFEMEVYDFLKSRGFSVDTQVGCSGFKIDIGLKRENSSDYVLAIECDGASYHSSRNARDRDRLRQEILERMGWKFYRIWSTDWFKNKSVEQQKLFDAAISALNDKNDVSVATENTDTTDTSFESIEEFKSFKFPEYKTADINRLANLYLPNNFKSMIKAILETEAPLSEEFLLKRIAYLFGREKVTNVVQQSYEYEMRGCNSYGIIRQKGFLYLQGKNYVRFRSQKENIRDIKYISPEELADGMLSILKQNISADKNGLYHTLAVNCGVTRVGKAMYDYFDAALDLLKGKIKIDGEIISIK